MNQYRCNKYFWVFAILHTIIWTCAFAFLRHSLAHDAIETVMWGQNLEWGYDKHPFFSAWIAHIAAWKIGYQWLIYLISEIYVVIGFWAIWQIANKIFNPIHALCAVIILEALEWYAFSPGLFNVNTPLLAFWPLMLLFFYESLKKQDLKNWLLVGVFSALAMITKYQTAQLLLIMLIFLLITAEGRASFKQKNIYFAVIVFILICLPNFIWLKNHNFISINYFLGRKNTAVFSLLNNFIEAGKFIYWQIIRCIVPAILFSLVFARKTNNRKIILAEPQPINFFDKKFILILGLGCLVFTIFGALFLSWKMYAEWATPMMPFLGLIFLTIKEPFITQNSFKRFISAIIITVIIMLTGYVLKLYTTKTLPSDNYPGPEIATAITNQWHDKYHKPLKYIAGSRYIAGYIAFYSKDHPKVLPEWNTDFGEWIDLNDLQKYGAVFVQDGYYGSTVFDLNLDIDDGKKFPDFVLKQFPNLQIQPLQHFKPIRGKYPKTIDVLVGFLTLTTQGNLIKI